MADEDGAPLTEKQWRSNLLRLTVARMVAGGIVPHKLDTVMKPLRPALTVVKSLGSAGHARKTIPGVVKDIEEILVDVLSQTPAVVLMMDGGDVKFGDGQAGKMSIYDIYAYSAYLPRPLLQESLTVRTGPDGGTDSDDISKMLKDVQEKYKVRVSSPHGRKGALRLPVWHQEACLLRVLTTRV